MATNPYMYVKTAIEVLLVCLPLKFQCFEILTSWRYRDKSDTRCDDGFRDFYDIRVQEEKPRAPCDEFAQLRPGEIRTATEHDSDRMTYNRLFIDSQLVIGYNDEKLKTMLTVCRRMLLRKQISVNAITVVIVQMLIILNISIGSCSKSPLSSCYRQHLYKSLGKIVAIRHTWMVSDCLVMR